ncbi:MAG: hypothetical protein KKE96_04580 [Candidatus Altiarchaeota archaeon]|nr:hypothetical protein [Candidatus Altiarchaeota archaeon]MBU4341748.1 hypothetical protein [Candidatus Altiarchaeota archaeon]MBU4437586.1 hypothetical protein [Candidatus Altiarchaeota archaeon]
MCRGYFQEDLPHISLRIILPPSNVFPEKEIFLIDTGSNITTLSYPTARRLGIDLDSLSDAEVVGTGGVSLVYIYDGIGIVFVDYLGEDRTEFHIEPVEPIHIFTKEAQTAPNILGCDVLNRFDISLNFKKGEINVERMKNMPPNYIEKVEPI